MNNIINLKSYDNFFIILSNLTNSIVEPNSILHVSIIPNIVAIVVCILNSNETTQSVNGISINTYAK